eukprot:m.229289 g.229289  ORF g.229289 m.229289 type:complete len:700 (-) comp33557_c6_seq1:881-2980(-)
MVLSQSAFFFAISTSTFAYINGDDADKQPEVETTRENLLDTLDIVVLTLVAGALIFLGLKKLVFQEEAPAQPKPSRRSSMVPTVTYDSSNFVEKMKATDKTMIIFFGSQTGTAEEYATRLVSQARSYGIKALASDLQDYDMEQLNQLREEIPNAIVVFCLATYGEGDPTDNAQEFYDLLKGAEESAEVDFKVEELNFAVFGLGNKTYEFFNSVAIYTDTRLAAHGGNRLVPVGLGDDDDNIENDFAEWNETFWKAACKSRGIDADAVTMHFYRQYAITELDATPNRLFTGEPAVPGQFARQKRPFTQKNPYLAKIEAKRELFNDKERSCLHIEFGVEGSGIRYTAGDHLAIYAKNNENLVEEFGRRLNVDLDKMFTMDAIDDDISKKHPFPCPCSYRTALLHYVDITSVPKMHLVHQLAEYTDDAKVKAHLELMTSKQGKAEYAEWVLHDQRTLMQILTEYPSLQPPMDLLLEMLPRLQPRYYSISSSPKLHRNSIHITAVLVSYKNRTGYQAEGVCTGLLASLNVGDTVPIFTRTSTFRLPLKSSSPIVMIGPGTGLAPFRGFIQDRAETKKNGKLVGDSVLFYGCQKRAQHFLYEEELLGYSKDGVISDLHLAFSRDGNKKVYVQHKLEEHGAAIYDLLKEKKGHVYVCGDAKNMAREVNEGIINLGVKHGGLSHQSATNWVKMLRANRRYSEDVWS